MRTYCCQNNLISIKDNSNYFQKKENDYYNNLTEEIQKKNLIKHNNKKIQLSRCEVELSEFSIGNEYYLADYLKSLEDNKNKKNKKKINKQKN